MTLALWKRILRTPHGAALGLCILLLAVFMAVASPILPLVLATSIGLDKIAVVAFFLLFTLSGIVISLVTGYLSDGMVARHKLVLVCGLIAVAGNLIIATTTQLFHPFIAGPLMVCLGVLFPQLFAAAKSGIVATWEPEAQVMGITALRTLYSFGFVLGTALGGWLVGVLALQSIYFLLAGGCLALTLFSARTLYQIDAHITPPALQPAETGAAQPVPPGTGVSLAALGIPLLALLVLVGADSTRQTYISLVMFQLFNDASISPLMFGITAAFELITVGLLGYFASRSDERMVIAVASLFGAAYFVVMASSQSLPLLYLFQAEYAIFVAALVGVAMAYVQGLLAHRAGLGGSLYIVVLDAGSLVGILAPLLVTGYDQKIFYIPAVLCVVGALMLMVAGASTARVEKRQAVPATSSDD